MAYKSVGTLPPTVYMTKETPSLALYASYALHDKGVYVNGEKVITESDLHNYNADSSTWFSDLQKTEILASFNAVANYNSFQGQTQSGLEGRWLGYRNNNYGCAIYMTRTRIIALYITGGEITKMKTIIDLS